MTSVRSVRSVSGFFASKNTTSTRRSRSSGPSRAAISPRCSPNSVVDPRGRRHEYVIIIANRSTKASRIAILGNLANPSVLLTAAALQESSRALGVSVELVNVQRVEDFDPVFAIIVAGQADGIIAMADPFVFAHMARVMELGLRNELPVIAFFRESVLSGVLMTYGPSLVQAMQRATVYVDKILKGAKPADLPVEQPTKFDLVINLKTAKAFGLTVPPSLLLRADQVIE